MEGSSQPSRSQMRQGSMSTKDAAEKTVRNVRRKALTIAADDSGAP
jgi:hypothetical protein